MKLSAFDFRLPERLIAQNPLKERDQARMMVVRRDAASWEHRIFHELPEILGPEHFLVLNNTRVFPARLRARRPGRQEQIEVLLIREERPGDWLALIRPGRKALLGQELEIADLHVRIIEIRGTARLLRFDRSDIMAFVERVGEPPLPPYIRRRTGQDLGEDSVRYQTVYAKHTGSIAAPTAGLHFTPGIMQRLEDRGIARFEILLHVGYGTFQPVRCNDIKDHRMEPEYFEVSEDAWTHIDSRKSSGQGLVAVGTTTTRVLEYLKLPRDSILQEHSGFCDLFIYPGFEFRILNGLLTNFHLPRSTPFMLVCAFAGREWMLECYREAISKGYRFYSYGDCMLVL